MKYLKSFSESNTNNESKSNLIEKIIFFRNRKFSKDDLADILDVFQDLIDEYNIEPNDDNEFGPAVAYNIIYITKDDRKYYHFPVKNLISEDLSIYKEIAIRIYLPITVERRQFFKYENQDKIVKDAQDFNKRLNLMGYNSKILQVKNNQSDYLNHISLKTDIIQAITIRISTTFPDPKIF